MRIRRLLPCLLLAAAHLVVTPPAADALATPAAPAPSSSHRVTLLTGDVVSYTESPGGQRAVHVDPAGRADRPPAVFHTMTDDDGLYVYPSDALPLITSGRVARTLFNVTGLVRAGLSDSSTASLPVIVTGGGFQTAAHTRVQSINGAGIRVDKAKAAEFWHSVTAEQQVNSVAKVLLDRPIRVSLERSTGQVGAPAAWQSGFDGTGTTVAVVDTGLDPDHPDLAGQVVESANFTDEPDTSDAHGHGTHVASVIAGSGKASGGRNRGVAPGAKLVVAKVFDASGQGETSRIMAGIEWAASRGAKVVNLSLGGEATDGTDELSALVDSLTEQTGALFVVAAGNNGPGPKTVSTPGSATSALTVGAVDRQNKIADFSGRGPRLGDAAVKPEIAAPGVGIVAARAAGTTMGVPVDEHYTAASGTSMATPHVAGAAALLAQQHPTWPAATLKSALVTSARDAGLGWHEQGSGVLDIARAISRAAFATPAVNFGRTGEPREITYVNDSGTPLTLNLSTTFRGWDGRAASLRLGASRITVPAHGKASTELSFDVEAAGVYGGTVVARGSAEFRTPVSSYLAPQLFPVRVHVNDSAGPAPSTIGQLIDDSAGADNTNDPFDTEVSYAFDVVDGEGGAEVPAGTYSAVSWTKELKLDGRRWTALAAPELSVKDSLDVTLDSSQAVPINVVAPEPVDQRDRTIMVRRVVAGHIEEAGLILGGSTWQPYATPAAATKVGAISLQDNVTLQDAAVTMRAGSTVVHPEYDAGTLSARWPGEHTLPVVTGGDVAGKAVLVRIPAPTGPGDPVAAVFRAATQAAQANAAAALVITYVDLPNAVPISGLSSAVVPTMSVSRAEADLLRTNVSVQVRPSPREVFNLSFLDPNGIPADHLRTVNRDELVRIPTSYHADKPGVTAQKTWYPFPTGLWQTQFLNGVKFPMPAKWTEYIGPADARMVWKRVVTASGVDDRGARAQLSMYQQNVYKPGEKNRADEKWFSAPLHSNAVELQPDHPARYPDGDVWRQLCSLCRVGDLFVPALNWSDGNAGHFTNPYENGKYKASTKAKLFSGDTEIKPDNADNPFAPFPVFRLAAEPRTYRLVTTDTQQPLFRLAPKVETTWTFQSRRSAEKPPRGYSCFGGGANCAFQPLIQLHHRFPLDLDNQAPGGSFTFSLEAAAHTGGGRPVTQVKVSSSTDDGKTWQQGTVAPKGTGTWAVTVTHPAGSGHVWLRTDARDASGNTVSQTMQRAYGFTSR